MIYSIIFDTKNRENLLIKRFDCRVMRQSPYGEIADYIYRARNDEVRAERLGAYTALFTALKHFFDIEKPIIVRPEGEKPRIISHNIFFNISHSDGLCIVTISDECDVGVDIQCEPPEERKTALEKRFLKGFIPCPDSFDIRYYLLREDELYELDLPHSNCCNFTDRWSAMESLMKLYSKGFSSLSCICEYAEKARLDIRNIEINNKSFSIANSIKNG